MLQRITGLVLAMSLLTTGCGSSVSTTLPPTSPPQRISAVSTPSGMTATPVASPTFTATPPPLPPTATPTPVPPKAWVDPALPADIRAIVEGALDKLNVLYTHTADDADLRVAPNLQHVLFQRIYALVVPFPTLTDEVTWAEVRRFWAGEPGALSAISRDAQSPTLYITAETLAMVQVLLGEPAPGAPIQIVSPAALLEAAWAARPHAWSIVPFDQLVPKWKVLRIDGINVLERGLQVYPLAVSIGVEGPAAGKLLSALVPDGRPLTNRDETKLTSLIMTGVTALVRATAYEMEQRGVLYPAEHVGALLRSADITHISNEIPFASNCPPPDRAQQSLVFCSDPKYIELLRAVGTDLVELTGNHFQDYGSEATLMTLEIYAQEGWPHYGGGADLEDARRPITLTHNGNRLSFIGCNPVGPAYAWATKDRPGAAPCDFEYMHGELQLLAKEVDVPIVTWQYWEHYQYPATPQQELDFRGMVDAGAKIVSGSQAHHPQAIEFYKDGFIHYGLGNLFFDQMWSLGTRQEMIDRHILYDGRHISTELFTYMLENFAQPRPMTTEEREQLLTAVFEASGW
ncbi:MAG: CapA family protein [Chloroflexi bacterium]|nr:CapA family protein [Chloroflexota bacterium]